MSPSKKERVFEKNYAFELLRIADGDYKTALVLSQSSDVRVENTFYMLQQTLEKTLKAVLVHQGISVPLIHDLGALLAKIPQDIEPPYGYELNELNQYAAVRRYEEASFSPSEDELADAISKTQDMLNWAKKILIPLGK